MVALPATIPYYHLNLLFALNLSTSRAPFFGRCLSPHGSDDSGVLRSLDDISLVPEDGNNNALMGQVQTRLSGDM